MNDAAHLKPYQFNAESARQAALKSHLPDSARFVRPVLIETEAQQGEDFRLQRLAIVRAEIVRLDKLISSEDDPKRLRDLYAAVDIAQERERRLAGRSLPPTIRAGSNRRQRQVVDIGPGYRVEDEPAEPTTCASDAPTSGVPAENSKTETPQGTNPQ